MTETPINMAQSQPREITVPGAPSERLVEAFNKEWRSIGKVGADTIIKNTVVLSAVYGISSLGVGERGKSSADPLELDKIAKADLYFNIFDPLNTAGSLVLDQDPNSPDFMKPRSITVAGQAWHPSRTCVVLNDMPVYIQFTSSAFGFVGRSVYQRALFPLKTVLQSTITDNFITIKCGLLIAKIKSAGAIITDRIQQMFGFKRSTLQAGTTGNVLSIGSEDSVESIDLKNIEGPARFARENAFKNCATAANMPAKILEQETMVSGFGEGSEDAKQIARYIDRKRIEMNPIYSFMDEIVMRRAWSEEFYKTLHKDFPEYKKIPYITAFTEWKNSFTAIWPNLLAEPDSEKLKGAKNKFESAVAVVESTAPLVGPKGKARLVQWLSDVTSEATELFATPLVFEEDELDEPPAMEMQSTSGEEDREPTVVPFSARS